MSPHPTISTVPLLAAALSIASIGHPIGIRPSFDAGFAAWHASHIVIVDEGAVIDGVVGVGRSLVGDLDIGAEIRVPGLEVFAASERRAVHELAVTFTPEREVSCRRMLLYLRREGGEWIPAGREGRAELSVAFLMPSGPYGLLQLINPGEAQPAPLGGSEAELIAHSLHVAADRTAMTRAIGEPNDSRRAHALLDVLSSSSVAAGPHVLSALLDRCGEPGAAAVTAILADDRHLVRHHWMLAQLERRPVGLALVPIEDLLRRELAFWKGRQPTEAELAQPAPTSGVAADHYRRAQWLIGHVANHASHAAETPEWRELAAHFRDRPEFDEWLRPITGRSVATLLGR